jgi:hypothetical protein
VHDDRSWKFSNSSHDICDIELREEKQLKALEIKINIENTNNSHTWKTSSSNWDTVDSADNVTDAEAIALTGVRHSHNRCGCHTSGAGVGGAEEHNRIQRRNVKNKAQLAGLLEVQCI